MYPIRNLLCNALAIIPKIDTMMNAFPNDLTLFYPLAFDKILKLLNFRREKLFFRVILIEQHPNFVCICASCVILSLACKNRKT